MFLHNLSYQSNFDTLTLLCLGPLIALIGGMVGHIAMAATKTTLNRVFENILGKALENLSPLAAKLKKTWVFGFELEIDFKENDVTFAFVSGTEQKSSVSATEGLVAAEIGLEIEVSIISRIPTPPSRARTRARAKHTHELNHTHTRALTHSPTPACSHSAMLLHLRKALNAKYHWGNTCKIYFHSRNRSCNPADFILAVLLAGHRFSEVLLFYVGTIVKQVGAYVLFSFSI